MALVGRWQLRRAVALLALVAGLMGLEHGFSQETAPADSPTDSAPPSGNPSLPTDDLTLRPGVDSTDPNSAALPATSVPDSSVPDQLAAQQKALADIEASITLSKEKSDQLKAEIEAMKGDRSKQNAALIAAAERVKRAEADIASLEDKLGELIAQELSIRGRLDGADANVANVLAALERISRNPPPALIVDPDNALNSARSALLISAIVPELRKRADAVLVDLKRLSAVKAEALEQQQQLEANLQTLQEEQVRIAALVAARKQSEGRAADALAAQEAEAEALAGKAASLQQLIDELSRRAAAIATAAQATETAESGGNTPRLDPETIRIALANTQRTQPAIPFAQAKGYLTMPANGVMAVDYGASDGFGGISRGLSLITRSGAQVVAPADGWVLFRGDYLNYGQIVILNVGQDYTVLLAGLSRVDVDVGQFVMMGEPVGSMGSQTIGRAVATSAGVSRPTLYIEMRKASAPVDPTGWWSKPPSQTQSG